MHSQINAIISTYPPFNTISFTLSQGSTSEDLLEAISQRHVNFPVNQCNLAYGGGKLLSSSPLPDGPLFLRLTPRLCGGKGGFGAQLRSAGGRMSGGKNQNKDTCRDLSGRRIGTLKTAQKLADYIASEPQREAEKQKRIRDKIDAGLNPPTKRIKFDDHKFFEDKEELVDNAKSAVMAAFRKKKKPKKADGDKVDGDKTDFVVTKESQADKTTSIAVEFSKDDKETQEVVQAVAAH